MIILPLIFLSTSVLSTLSEERLPTNVIPFDYMIDIEIDTETRKISGEVCIQLECKTNTNEIKLHAKKKYGLKLEEDIKIKYRRNTSQQVHINSKKYNEESDILTLETTPLQAGKDYELCISYKGDITEANNYIIWESTEQPQKRYIIATNFERQSAFPCFDEPSFRTTFVLKLSIRSSENSFSNAARGRTVKPDKEGWVQEKYIVLKEMPPSQIAFVVTNYEFYSYIHWFCSEWSPLFKGRPEVKDKLNLEAKLSDKRVTTEYQHFGPMFTFPDVTFIIVPTDKQIYSRYWKLVLIRESDLTVDSDEDMAYNIYVGMTRQWFGAMVSPDSWDSAWIYDALASYTGYLQIEKQPYLEDIPSFMWQTQSDNLEENINKGMDPFMNVKVGASKGLMLLRMVQSVLGKDQFAKAIQDFIRNYRKESTAILELWETFDGRSKGLLPKGFTWSKIMKQWTEQEGYPVVTVKSIENGKFKLSQEPFGYNKQKSNTQPAKSDTTCWWVPLTFTSGNDLDLVTKPPLPDNWIGCDSKQEISVQTKARKEDYVIFNINYAGLCRVKYDDDIWKLIVTALETNHQVFNPYVRAQLVNDALALAWQGHVKYEYAFKLLPYLREETNNNVWNLFFMEALNLKDILQASPETNTKFLDFTTHILDKALINIYKDKKFELFDSMDKSSKSNVQKVDSLFYSWSCITLRIDSCITKALSIFDEWRTKDAISANIQGFRKSLFSTIFCTVLKEQKENDELWLARREFFLKALKGDFKEYYYRPVILDVLRCTSDKETINSLLEWTTSSTPDKTTLQEKQRGFLELARGSISSGSTWDYFHNNIDKIQTFYQSDDVLAEVVKVLTSKMNSDQLEKMKTFVATKLANEKIKSALNEGEVIAKLKMEWLNKNDMEIRETLDALIKDKFKSVNNLY